MYSLAKDQNGCRLLQRLLEEQRVGVVDVVYEETFPHLNELMTDPFGNYLCQKLIEHCSEQQRLSILSKVAPDVVAISLNLHGTRAVQKLVESISTPRETELLVASIRTAVVSLVKDLNGNHVIQRCLHHLSSADNQVIYDAVCRHCVSVSTHKHGCCVLQRCIDYATVGQKRQLIHEICVNALELVQDAYGNYVVQYVLDLNDPASTAAIVTNLAGHIGSLSVQKFSSNCVEKCLELANDKLRSRMIDELVNPERLPRLLQDPYANYVLQKALSVSKKQQLDRLVSVIRPHLHQLKNTAFGQLSIAHTALAHSSSHSPLTSSILCTLCVWTGKRIQNKILKKFPDLDLEPYESVQSAVGSTTSAASLPLQPPGAASFSVSLLPNVAQGPLLAGASAVSTLGGGVYAAPIGYPGASGSPPPILSPTSRHLGAAIGPIGPSVSPVNAADLGLNALNESLASLALSSSQGSATGSSVIGGAGGGGGGAVVGAFYTFPPDSNKAAVGAAQTSLFSP